MMFSAFVTAAVAFGGPATWLIDDDGGPGVAFTDLPAAVAAASDGDVLLVRPGTYSGFTTGGKSLRILATDLLSPPAVGASSFPGPSTADAFVQGLNFLSGPGQAAGLVSGGGRTTFADCSFFGGVGATGLRVDGGAATLERCLMIGGPSAVAGGTGAHCIGGGTIAFDLSTILGGFGLSSAFTVGVGGHALFVDGGTASGTRSSLFGGGVPIVFGSSATAGDGLRVQSGFARLAGESFDVVAGGGAFGIVGAGVATTPGAGVRTSAGGSAEIHGALFVLGGEGVIAGAGPDYAGLGATAGPALPRLEVTGDVTAAGVMTVQLELAPPLAPFAMILAFGPAFAVPVPLPLAGDFMLDATAVAGVFGMTDAIGGAAFSGSFGTLDAGFVGTPLHLQSGTFDGGQWRVSNPVIHFLR